MSKDIAGVLAYHRSTKHHFSAYAPSPGFLDWDSQPDPFRRYTGAPLLSLPFRECDTSTSYSQLYEVNRPAELLSRSSIGAFFELAFGLSAWKSTGMESWALRHNPSSGNLHPTEAYLVLWKPVDNKFVPGVYHYAAYEHGLELRAVLAESTALKLQKMQPDCFGALGLTSIHWREEWKYGARALRYCQHDVGHALASASYSAAILGWQVKVDPTVSDSAIEEVLGLSHLNNEAEPEAPGFLAYLAPVNVDVQPTAALWGTLAKWLNDWKGRANQLSREHAHWPEITGVLPLLRNHGGFPPKFSENHACSEVLTKYERAAEIVIRQRRSAQRMQLGEGITRNQFLAMLSRCLPGEKTLPFGSLPFLSAINLMIFVHQVEGMEPGLYTLVRSNDHFENFKEAVAHPDNQWHRVQDTSLPLYTLRAPVDFRKVASQLSCYQGIAGHSAFSVGMIANLHATLETEGAWAYRRLFWEAGLIGHVLYLEAEACGVQGTGIGCYFDDNVHDFLGLQPEGSWQSLYHFTVGVARTDQLLATLSGYHHLQRGRGKKVDAVATLEE